MSDAPMEVPDKVELEGEMKSQISLPYVQALSKIAFHFVLAHFHFTGSKITAPVLGWVEVSVIRSDIPAVVVAESFSTCACTWIVG